jgi:aryl-alcohol dehydrogenase-like predicted oxidoreductase
MTYPSTIFRPFFGDPVTVRFQITAGNFGSMTFDNGSDAYDFVRAAIDGGHIINLSNVYGPGASEYSERASEVHARSHRLQTLLATAVAESVKG